MVIANFIYFFHGTKNNADCVFVLSLLLTKLEGNYNNCQQLGLILLDFVLETYEKKNTDCHNKDEH